MQRATVVYRVWAVSPTHTNYRTERLRTATETLLTGGRRALVWVHERKRAPYRTQSDGRRTKSTRLHGEHEISGDWSEMTCILFSKGRHDVRWYRAQSQVAWEIFQGISRHPCGISCLLYSHYDPQQSPSIPLRKTARFCVHEATRGVPSL